MTKIEMTALNHELKSLMKQAGLTCGGINPFEYHRRVVINVDTYNEANKSRYDVYDKMLAFSSAISNDKDKNLSQQRVVSVDRDLDKLFLIVPALQFKELGFEPKRADKIVYNHVQYIITEVNKRFHLGGSPILYMLNLIESPIGLQRPQERELMDNSYQTDATKEYDDTNTTGVNDFQYDIFPAVLVSSIQNEYEILFEKPFLIFQYNTNKTKIFLPARCYTTDSLVNLINTFLKNTPLFAENNNGYLSITTDDLSLEFSLLTDSSSAAAECGFLHGLYKPEKVKKNA